MLVCWAMRISLTSARAGRVKIRQSINDIKARMAVSPLLLLVLAGVFHGWAAAPTTNEKRPEETGALCAALSLWSVRLTELDGAQAKRAGEAGIGQIGA